jgi:hypothetical protein
MLLASCAGFVVGSPLIATAALRELRDLLSALFSAPPCDKASLKLSLKEGRNESSTEVSTRATQPSPGGTRRAGAAARQAPTTHASSD